MPDITQWLNEYGESHQNRTNKLIHWICVPAIYWSIMMLLWAVPQPAFMKSLPYLNWSVIAAIAIIIYYLKLSASIASGMLLFTALLLFLNHWLETAQGLDLMLLGIGIFVIAWIFQFIGHKIEGKKPSFFKDIQFLLIGPIWLMSAVYRRLGIPY